MESFRYFFGYFTEKISSSDFFRSLRRVYRSTGVSLEPSGIQMLWTEGVPSCFPISAAIARHLFVCSIQNLRIPGFLLDKVNPSSASGWEKQVQLKSRPIFLFLAQFIHPLKCFQFDLVTVNCFSSKLTINGVKIQPLSARQ